MILIIGVRHPKRELHCTILAIFEPKSQNLTAISIQFSVYAYNYTCMCLLAARRYIKIVFTFTVFHYIQVCLVLV
jgi:hypothetical protein